MYENANNTSSEVAADYSEQNTTAAAPASVESGDRVWDSLNFLKQELCAFNLIPAMLVPHVRDREVVAKVPNPRENLLAPMQILSNDVAEFRERLEQIAAKHANRTGSSDSADEQMEAIQINEEYIQWGMQYESVVTPNVLGMMNHLLAAGAGIDPNAVAAKPSDVIEAHMAADAEVDNV